MDSFRRFTARETIAWTDFCFSSFADRNGTARSSHDPRLHRGRGARPHLGPKGSVILKATRISIESVFELSALYFGLLE